MRTVGLAAIGMVLAVACGQPHPTPKASASASASPAGAGATSLAAWRACGSDTVPPANVLATPKLPVKVDASRTNGTVSQREADRWAAAFLREQAVETWALTTNRSAMLSGGCLGALNAYDNLFAGEVANMRKAQAAGGHLQYDPPASITGLAIVPAPQSAQDYALNLSGERPAYALVETLHGPLKAYVVTIAGQRQPLGPSTPADEIFRQAFFGHYANPAVGPLWFQLADDDCQSPWVAGACTT
jgi:hypothetical protein